MAIVFICLPLAKSLNSLQLVSITTAMVIFTLAIDVYGGTSIHEPFWTCNNQCKYRTHCPLKRKLLVEAVKNGTTIKLNEVHSGDGEKAFYDVSLDARPRWARAYADFYLAIIESCGLYEHSSNKAGRSASTRRYYMIVIFASAASSSLQWKIRKR